MKLKIGSIELKNNIVLAPMAGITNESFRLIAKRMGAGLVVAEMVSDKGLTYQNERTEAMIIVSPEEHPVSMQIFGSDYETMTKAAKLIESSSGADIIDINMGCPVPKVINKGGGSALLKDPNQIYDIVKSIKDNISLPLTVKIRAGWDKSSVNCDEIAKVITKAGADAITIHGRTRAQIYRGEVNLEYIKMVKDATHLPVIGNGDIKTIADADLMFKATGVDGIMIGRGSLGNPWIFRDLNRHYLGLDALNEPSPAEVIDLVLEHAQNLIALKGERIAMIEMRGHLSWYFRRLPYSKPFRPLLVMVKTYAELEKLVFNYLASIK